MLVWGLPGPLLQGVQKQQLGSKPELEREPDLQGYWLRQELLGDGLWPWVG